MARKRKRRAAAATTTPSKLAAKETMAITSLSLSAGLPVLQKLKKNSSNNVSAERPTLLETEKEELDSITSPANNTTEIISEPPKSQSPITTASCRRKQAKPQRKNGES